MRSTVGLIFLIPAICITVSAQAGGEKVATSLQQFEVDWLTADLNNDHSWQQRFYDGKVKFQPANVEAVRQRAAATNNVLNPSLAANEMKVRITGTITLLTSDPTKNRSFQFLDTFNKKDGKWQVIASSTSPTGGSVASVLAVGQTCDLFAMATGGKEDIHEAAPSDAHADSTGQRWAVVSHAAGQK